MSSNWYDDFSKNSSRSTNDIVMLSSVINGFRKIEKDAELNYSTLFLESFVKELRNSKKVLSKELKEVIDVLSPSFINTVWGSTEYLQKTPVGYAIDEIHIEALEYLLKCGANVNVPGSNQQHVLQELLESNATDKRIKILEMVLENLEPNTVKLKKGFDGKYYSIKYLISLVNSTQFTESEIKEIYDYSSPKNKALLVENCVKFQRIDEDTHQFPQDIRDLFLC